MGADKENCGGRFGRGERTGSLGYTRRVRVVARKSTFAVEALSLTTSAVARVIFCVFSRDRTHVFIGAQIASVSGVLVHLRHPNVPSPVCSHQCGVAHQSSLRSPTT